MSARPTTPEPTRESLAGWLRAMPPARRNALAALLADHATAGLLAEIRREAAYEATRTATYAQVAAQWGVTVPVVHRLVDEHNRAKRKALEQKRLAKSP